MKILLISRGWPSKTSPQWGCFERDQALALKKLGHEVIIMSIDGRLGHFNRKLGISYIKESGICIYSFFLFPLPLVSFLSLFSNFFRICAAIYLYKKISKKEGKIDIIYSHYLYNTYSVICLKKIFHIPIVAIEHWSRLNADSLPWIIRHMGRYAYSNADCIIAVSNSLKIKIKLFFNFDSIVIFNMVGTEFDNSYSLDKFDNFTFIAIGSLVKRKGFDVLIEAFVKAKIPITSQLFIVGEGCERDNLLQKISSLGERRRISLLGAMTKDDISKLLGKCHVFILSSRKETFGVVCIEAFMLGLPVIATICGGPEEYVNENNGILIPTDDVKALAFAIEKMYMNYSSYKLKCIAKNCKNSFSSEVIGKKIEAILYNTLKKNNSK